MAVRYLTIEREYGSGGTEIASCLSQETGVPCYGREILEEVAKKQDLSVEEIQRYEETVKNSFLYSMFAMAQATAGESDMLSKEGHIFIAEQAVIQDMARQGRAIFLGHCASEALKATPDTVRVFIRCSDELRKAQRIREDYGIQEHLVESTKKRFDRKRANYYYANTGRKWEDPCNYDIVLDSGILRIEGCVAMLKVLFCL